MSRVADQAYLNTRVSVMATRLFAPDAGARLARLQLSEVAERFGLPSLLDEQQGPASRGRAIEQSLVQVLLADLQVLVRPMKADERALVLAWGRKYALFNLKTLIRGKLHNLDQKEIRDSLFDLPAIIVPPDQEMLRAENVLELLRQLEAGPYRLIARHAREVYEQRREPFALEAAIDQRYYVSLVQQLRQLPDDDRPGLQRLVGAELDRVALLWLLRFRLSYRLSPSETFFQLVPSMGLLRRERLLALVNIETFSGVLEALPAPLDRLLADCPTLIEVQRHMDRYVADVARQLLRHSRCGVTRALAYLMLREMDLFLLFALIQGRLLQLPAESVDVALGIREPRCHWTGADVAPRTAARTRARAA